MTQGEVVSFAAGAAATMRADGCNVLVEGREQTLDHVRACMCTACACALRACALRVPVHCVCMWHVACGVRACARVLHAHRVYIAGAHAAPLRADSLRAAAHRDATRGAADARRGAEAGGGWGEARRCHADAGGRAGEDQPGVSGTRVLTTLACGMWGYPVSNSCSNYPSPGRNIYGSLFINS